VNGRHLAIGLGVIILLGAAYATHTIHHEKVAHFQRAAALTRTLQTMREAIADFHAREGRYPRALTELVPKDLPRIPTDPVTESASTWRVTTEETVQPSSDFTTTSTITKSVPYIVEVRSGASGKDANGKPFADY
jgi:hypothetical protein